MYVKLLEDGQILQCVPKIVNNFNGLWLIMEKSKISTVIHLIEDTPFLGLIFETSEET